MNLLLSFRNITVSADSNPALAELGEEHDRINSDFNELNSLILAESPPQNPAQADVERWESYGRGVDALQNRMLKWEAKAREFIMSPRMSYQHQGTLSDDDRREAQQQMVSSLTLARSDMAEARRTLFNNHERLVSDVKHRDSAKLAMRSFRIGKWGLIAGIVGVVLAIISLAFTLFMAA